MLNSKNSNCFRHAYMGDFPKFGHNCVTIISEELFKQVTLTAFSLWIQQ